jgi:hypothetical protein
LACSHVISTTASTSFITKAGEQPEEKDEGNVGEEQQQGQGYGQKSIVSSCLSKSLATAFTASCSDIIAGISCLAKATIPFELVLYLIDILSAATITAAGGSANRDRIPSKSPMRQLVPPLVFFAPAFFFAVFVPVFFAAVLSDRALSGTAFIEEPLFFCSFC